MREQQLSHQCIVFRGGLRDVQYFSVKEYDDALARAAREQSAYEPSWKRDAPPVENLTSEWRFTPAGKFRILNEGVYELQMLQLMGLEPDAPYWILRPLKIAT